MLSACFLKSIIIFLLCLVRYPFNRLLDEEAKYLKNIRKVYKNHIRNQTGFCTFGQRYCRQYCFYSHILSQAKVTMYGPNFVCTDLAFSVVWLKKMTIKKNHILHSLYMSLLYKYFIKASECIITCTLQYKRPN